jgi:MoaA/NifB/PqqE/SkfB family radical SAM enzyme
VKIKNTIKKVPGILFVDRKLLFLKNYLRTKIPRIPSKKVDVFLNISTVCNYDCIFCNRDVEKKIIRLNDMKLDDLVSHARTVDITGYGEITCHPDFLEIIEIFSKKKIPIRFVTNGARLSKEYVDILINSEIYEIVISLNSLNSKTYSKLCGTSARLEKTLSNIEYLLSCNPSFPIRLSFVITSYNMNEIPDFIKYAKGKVASITCMGLTPTLQKHYPVDLIIENNVMNRKYLDSMRELATAEGVSAFILDLENQSTLDSPIDPVRLKKMIKTCDWVYSKFFVEPDGQVGPCCWSSVRLGSVKMNNFDEIWYGKQYDLLRNAIKEGNTTYCKNCRRLG